MPSCASCKSTAVRIGTHGASGATCGTWNIEIIALKGFDRTLKHI